MKENAAEEMFTLIKITTRIIQGWILSEHVLSQDGPSRWPTQHDQHGTAITAALRILHLYSNLPV